MRSVSGPADSPAGSGRVDEKDRPACIQAAALELVAEVGYERMTMDGIAARAKASKATIYRRWDSKAALVVEAIACRDGGELLVEPDTGDLRGDLIQGLTALAAQLADHDIGLITGLLSAMRTDAELAALLRAQIFESKQQAAKVWAAAAIKRGELSAEANFELVHEVVMSLLFQRIALTGAPVDDTFAEYLVDELLLPILTRPSRT